MRVVYFVLSIAIIALGIVHIAATPHLFSQPTLSGVWFASGGLAIILTGVLNLLNRAYGQIASGLRLVCVGTNVVMTCFSLLAGYVSRASALQFIFVIGLMAGTTIFSFLPGARLRKSPLEH
jgi:hypothetical protein